jgi:hypothetical protein
MMGLFVKLRGRTAEAQRFGLGVRIRNAGYQKVSTLM